MFSFVTIRNEGSGEGFLLQVDLKKKGNQKIQLPPGAIGLFSNGKYHYVTNKESGITVLEKHRVKCK